MTIEMFNIPGEDEIKVLARMEKITARGRGVTGAPSTGKLGLLSGPSQSYWVFGT